MNVQSWKDRDSSIGRQWNLHRAIGEYLQVAKELGAFAEALPGIE